MEKGHPEFLADLEECRLGDGMDGGWCGWGMITVRKCTGMVGHVCLSIFIVRNGFCVPAHIP